MRQDYPLTRDLVLVGGGHAHALVMRMWGMSPLPGARLTLVNPYPTAPYTGMLPGFVAGHYEREDVAIDMVKLARFAGARLIVDRAIALDRENRNVVLGSGRRLRYDVAAIDIGVTSQLPDLKGFPDFGTPVKPMDSFLFAWRSFVQEARAGKVAPEVAVIGGGVGGAELAMAIAHAMRDIDGARISIIEKDALLGAQDRRVATAIRSHLTALGVEVFEVATPREVTASGVELDTGDTIPSRFTISAAGARAQGWLESSTGLALKNGHIRVLPTLQSVTDPRIFASGDCAHLDHAPRPKAGVFAVRAAPVLHENLRAALAGQSLGTFQPQRDFLKLVSLGAKSAIAEKWGRSVAGSVMWRVKDRIDRKFMAQFQDLPQMAAAPLPREHALEVPEAIGPKPLCGGCGAKVAQAPLQDALAEVPKPQRDDIRAGAGDDAGLIAAPDGMMQVISTDHLRALTDDPFAMAKIALHHALGDVWAMGAAPQSILPHLILPRASDAIHRDMVAEIVAAVGQIANEEGAAIIGGHTSVGAELTVGFTVTGLAKKVITLGAAVAGDVLVLTKPIGTGTIMAAEMQMQAAGHIVHGAMQAMMQSQGPAARILAGAAHAMTDVTGFGLAGHARNLAVASGATIALDIARIPFLPGAVELAEQGMRSSLFPGNVAQAPELLDAVDPKTALLFDPQTSGGLLAALPRADAPGAIDALVAAGFEAAIIGEVTAGAPMLRLQALSF